ncbi:hypothetical protein [Streptomyces sp. NPDC050485]|uniref:hypothetical protein n=1 Tax=Streptomyces sp. NPDC050485 TaxID=3365617 RepID=UPI0037A47607
MPDSITLQSQYAVQVRTDLESNAAERERINSEIGVLQGQLKVLEDNHALLTAMQQALGTPTPPAATARKKKSSEPAPAGGRVPRARTSAETPSTGAKKQRKTAAKTRARGNGPTLRDLVAAHLTQTGNPASAAEITTILAAAHPERNIAATVVRNTLENLVAKGVAERTRQRRSVFYSLPAAAGTGTPAEPQVTSSGDLAATTEATA